MRNYVDILIENIESRLRELDRKPAWLSQKSGINASNISRLLDKKGNPTLESIVAIAEALQMDPDDLLKPTTIPADVGQKNDIGKLEQDLKYMLGKQAKIEALFADEIDPDVLKKLIESKEIIEDEARHIRDRITVLKKFKADEEKRKLRSSSSKEAKILNKRIVDILPSLNEDQLGRVLKFIVDLVASTTGTNSGDSASGL